MSPSWVGKLLAPAIYEGRWEGRNLFMMTISTCSLGSRKKPSQEDSPPCNWWISPRYLSMSEESVRLRKRKPSESLLEPYRCTWHMRWWGKGCVPSGVETSRCPAAKSFKALCALCQLPAYSTDLMDRDEDPNMTSWEFLMSSWVKLSQADASWSSAT